MAYHLEAHPSWNSGAGSQTKYQFNLDVNLDVVSVVGNTATISIVGTYGVDNYATNTSNAQKASDFAAVTLGSADLWNYQFTPYSEYYEASLPCAPNAPQSVRDGVIIEFRGDTWRSDPYKPGNRSSLYSKPSGVVLDQFYENGSRSFNINTTVQIDVSQGDVPVIAYVSSGWGPGPIYEWLSHEVWVSWFDLDYRPGAVRINGSWKSTNRSGGKCHLRVNGSWTEMRTVDGGLTGNPPSRRTSGSWRNQYKIGSE